MSRDLFIGIMSGTSLDGVDVALTAFEGAQCQLMATQFLTYPAEAKASLLALHFPTDNELEQTQLVANQLARLYAQAVNALLEKENLQPADIQAIGCHGQTIRHRPELGFTLQIGNSALLAELTGITVISDFRSRDIAAGGQGAPLVPAFHHGQFASADKNRCIVNIGGIANVTFLPQSGEVIGFDSGPGNLLLDNWIRLKLGKDYDHGGEWAASGTVHESFLNGMLAEPYFTMSPPKSTGRDLFNEKWLQQHILYPHCRPQDIARTLVALTAHSIAHAIQRYCPHTDEVYVCGGGAHNQLLMRELAQLLALPVQKTDVLGVPVDWVEAVAFAWLARQTMRGQPGNLPEVTGAQGERILGAIYPA